MRYRRTIRLLRLKRLLKKVCIPLAEHELSAKSSAKCQNVARWLEVMMRSYLFLTRDGSVGYVGFRECGEILVRFAACWVMFVWR